jgi:hypothetical protein
MTPVRGQETLAWITSDVYLGRRAVDSQAALALEAALRGVFPGGAR